MATPKIRIISTTTKSEEGDSTAFLTAEGYRDTDIVAICGGIYVYPERDKDGEVICGDDGSPALWYWDTPPSDPII